MPDCDYLVVGAGIIGLVAASILCKKGRKAIVLERNDRVGGCLRIEEITAPGRRAGSPSLKAICRPACFAPTVRICCSRAIGRATSRLSRLADQATAPRFRGKWKGRARMRPSCFRCSAANSGRGRQRCGSPGSRERGTARWVRQPFPVDRTRLPGAISSTSDRHHDRNVVRELRNVLERQVEVGGDHRWRRMGQPVGKRNIPGTCRP